MSITAAWTGRPQSPQDIEDSFSDEARAVVGTFIGGLERQIVDLRQQVQHLKAHLDQNSTNSCRPPSTDPIGVKRKAARPAVEEAPGRTEGASAPDEGVEPMNNSAERSLRHAVIWRRISCGTDSEVRSRFVERTVSVVATCRQGGVPVLRYLSE